MNSDVKKNGGKYIIRFSVRQRIEHVALMIIFVALASTGLLQRFYTGSLAQWVIFQVGGVEVIRSVHRLFGVVFTGGLFYHLAMITYGFLIMKQKQSMLVTRKDFTDVIESLKYALGTSSKRPEYGRFNYRQKFEYWGLMFGSVIITVTGIVLMFPIFITRYLPGQVVAASVEIHGWEATLAALTIVVWHLYEVMLRPGVFPTDTTIFTGRITEERMKEEHLLELSELTSEVREEPAALQTDFEADGEVGPSVSAGS